MGSKKVWKSIPVFLKKGVQVSLSNFHIHYFDSHTELHGEKNIGSSSGPDKIVLVMDLKLPFNNKLS